MRNKKKLKVKFEMEVHTHTSKPNQPLRTNQQQKNLLYAHTGERTV